MPKFKDYLIEMAMSFEKALKILNIDRDIVADKKELKKIYRKLVMQHHPDHGGDEEEFKKIDAAYKYLFNNTKQNDALSKWKEYDKKSKKMGDIIRTTLLSDLHVEIYQNYFNKHSGYNFFYEIKESKQRPGFEVEFFTKDRKTVFHLKIFASINDIMSGGLTAGGDMSYTIQTEAYGFHLNKKQKMSQRDWGITRDHSFLKNPEKLFPAKKMKDIFSGTTSKRKFAKRDMITFLKSKLGATLNKDFVNIPLAENYYLVIYRSTLMRIGCWNINGIYQATGKWSKSKVSHAPTASFIEEEETAKIFEKIQRESKKAKGEAIIKKTEKLITQAYEAYKKSKGI